MATLPSPSLPAPLRRIWYWVAGFALLAAAGACIYYWMFSRFSPWDDDGYLLIGIQSLLKGDRLYDDIYSQYGPFYYLFHWIAYSLAGLPASHEAQRFIGTGLWLVSAGLWARTTYLLTRSLLWSAFGFFVGIKLLEFFPWSAGHPEEICMALLAAIAILACGITPGNASRNVIGLGLLVAALTLTKVNMGLYAGVAVALFLFRISPPTAWRRTAEWLFSAAALLLPAALMATMFHFDWARNYAFVATAAIATAIYAAHRVELAVLVTERAWRTAAVSLLASALAVALPFFFRGTTLQALLRMTVLQHAGTARNWFLVAPIGAKVVLCMLVSAGMLAIAYGLVRRTARDVSGWTGPALLGLKAAVGLTALLALSTRNIRADNPIIFCYCVPFMWLILVGPDDETTRATRIGRMALCFLAVFTYLYAFPVAGAQVLFASVPAAIAAIVLLRDAASEIARAVPAALRANGLYRLAPALGCVVLIALFAVDIYDGHRKYAGGVSLGMPGAARIRVEPQESAAYRWIANNVRSCSALYSMPGQFSLNLWTALKSPTDLTAGNWAGLLDNGQQQAVVRDLSRYPGLCIVYTPELVKEWGRGQDLSKSPLARYIREEFVTVAGSDGNFILKRKDLAAPAVAHASNSQANDQ
uniref:Glycosyltransferase RgtA/B/C/D-like domain-containing protein n=1 Tax=Solibacter usitatus (strain Ellin6076) TaxID=234267 RepID=Q025S5_SOLUE